MSTEGSAEPILLFTEDGRMSFAPRGGEPVFTKVSQRPARGVRAGDEWWLASEDGVCGRSGFSPAAPDGEIYVDLCLVGEHCVAARVDGLAILYRATMQEVMFWRTDAEPVRVAPCGDERSVLVAFANGWLRRVSLEDGSSESFVPLHSPAQTIVAEGSGVLSLCSDGSLWRSSDIDAEPQRLLAHRRITALASTSELKSVVCDDQGKLFSVAKSLEQFATVAMANVHLLSTADSFILAGNREGELAGFNRRPDGSLVRSWHRLLAAPLHALCA